jgi:hypothetical protein
MKRKHLLLAISIGAAIGLFIGVNADFEKSNFLRMVEEIESCVEQGFSAKEEIQMEEEGIYQVKDYTPKDAAVLCKDKTCLPPSKRIKG